MTTKNILFIMCDQLRWDYLSCYGHPHLHTPHLDHLAAQGVQFDNAYVQSPICGPSRASMYSGRYISSIGTTTNFAPMRPDELMMGDYLNPLGMRTVLTGKTHLFPYEQGLKRLQVPAARAEYVAQGGFEATFRDDGLHPNSQHNKDHHYNVYLREQGYSGDNPWHTHANSSADANGTLYDGWFLESAAYPARVKEEHSETPYTVMRAMQFMENADDTPWCLHVSFIKPHWPIVAPVPYHNMYGPDDFLPLKQSEHEQHNPHPVFKAMMHNQESLTFSDQALRDYVLPAYMGLIKQIDDHVGQLFAYMEKRGLMDNTLIVFTSDHGDYLGDHYLGEKDFFHDCVAKVPLIIYDPSPEANATRGHRETRPVELLDLLPTFVEVAGGEPHFRLEGRSLLPLLHGQHVPWREAAVCEIDLGDRRGLQALDVSPETLWAVMLVDETYKYIAFNGMRPMLFDRCNDPDEQHDLGDHPNYAEVRSIYKDKLLNWFMTDRWRVTVDREEIKQRGTGYGREKKGIIIGYWNEDALPEEVKPFRTRNTQ